MATTQAKPGTAVVYNDVCLNNVTTRGWNEEIVYDQSGTDMLYKKFTLEFEGYLHVQEDKRRHLDVPGPFILAKQTANNATDTMFIVRRLLQTPRRTLMVVVNGKTLLECKPATKETIKYAHRDVNHGPRPLSVNITRIAGDQCYRVSFVIECAKLECSKDLGSYSGIPKVLSNRWSVSEEMDDNFFVTRIIRGRIRLSENVTVDPSYAKYMCLPKLEEGFRRVRTSFVADPNGLEAAYEVTDRQVAMSAPYPATSISGHHSFATGTGFLWHAECQVRLEGPPNVDRGQLIARALQCIDSRLNLYSRKFGGDKNQWSFAQGGGFTITLGFGEITSVEILARVMVALGPDSSQQTSYYFHTIPKELTAPWKLKAFTNLAGSLAEPTAEAKAEYSPTTSREPTIHGYHSKESDNTSRDNAVNFAIRCVAADPCSREGTWNLYSPPEDSSEEKSPKNTKKDSGTSNPDVQRGSIPADYLSNVSLVSDSAKSALYTYCVMESHYVTHHNRLQLPTAPAKSTQGQDTCFVATVAQPTCYRVMELDVERVGDWPTVPAPKDTYTDSGGSGLKGTLIDTSVRAHPPSPTADAERLIYRMAIKYIYAMNRPPTLKETVDIGVQPTVSSKADNYMGVLKPNAFKA